MIRAAVGAFAVGMLFAMHVAASRAQTPPPISTVTPTPSPTVTPSGTPFPLPPAPGQGGAPPVLVTPPLGLTPASYPFAPALASGCGRSGPLIEGGRSTGLSTGQIVLEVELPAPGTYYTLPGGPGGLAPEVPSLFICNVQSDSSIAISAVTGREVSRSARDQAAQELLSRIAASARLRPAPAPPVPPGVPAVAPGAVLRPPSTGDAGLR